MLSVLVQNVNFYKNIQVRNVYFNYLISVNNKFVIQFNNLFNLSSILVYHF